MLNEPGNLVPKTVDQDLSLPSINVNGSMLHSWVVPAQHGVYLKAGKVQKQDFKTKPMIPYYGQVGYTIRF